MANTNNYYLTLVNEAIITDGSTQGLQEKGIIEYLKREDKIQSEVHVELLKKALKWAVGNGSLSRSESWIKWYRSYGGFYKIVPKETPKRKQDKKKQKWSTKGEDLVIKKLQELGFIVCPTPGDSCPADVIIMATGANTKGVPAQIKTCFQGRNGGGGVMMFQKCSSSRYNFLPGGLAMVLVSFNQSGLGGYDMWAGPWKSSMPGTVYAPQKHEQLAEVSSKQGFLDATQGITRVSMEEALDAHMKIASPTEQTELRCIRCATDHCKSRGEIMTWPSEPSTADYFVQETATSPKVAVQLKAVSLVTKKGIKSLLVHTLKHAGTKGGKTTRVGYGVGDFDELRAYVLYRYKTRAMAKGMFRIPSTAEEMKRRLTTGKMSLPLRVPQKWCQKMGVSTRIRGSKFVWTKKYFVKLGADAVTADVAPADPQDMAGAGALLAMGADHDDDDEEEEEE
eukprot:g4544.t1